MSLPNTKSLQIDLSIVIPAYNEERRLPGTVNAAVEYLSAQDVRYEIIIVDDGSCDATARVAAEMSATHPCIRFLQLKLNSGKGRAVQAGMLDARGRLIFFIDADQSTPITELPKLFQPLVDLRCDVAMGSRALDAATMLRKQSFTRRLAGKGFGFILRNLLVTGFRDSQCGFKGFTRDAVEKIFPRLTCTNALFDMEVLLLAARSGMTVAEMPITWSHDPDSRLTYNLWGAVRLLREFLRIRQYWRVGFPVRLKVITIPFSSSSTLRMQAVPRKEAHHA